MTNRMVGAAVLAAVVTAGLIASPVMSRDTTVEAYKRVEVLLSASENIVGEPIVYPTNKPAKVTAAIVSMKPGEETGPHVHGVPLFAHMLEGEITVDYGPKGKRTYKKGDSFLEAMSVVHNGRNTGTNLARVMVVFMGAEGIANTTHVPKR